MSNRKLNLASNLYFLLILLSLILYTGFLAIAARKILPGFIMQLVFLLDILKFDNNIFELIFSKLFLLNVSSGLILTILIGKYLKSIFGMLKGIKNTRNFIAGFNVEQITDKYTKFHSKNNLIFTAGFIKPKIFISSSLFNTHTQEELTAMLYHEENHQQNHHPFKIFIAKFVSHALPFIPGKNWLIDNFLTLTEVSSDLFAEGIIKNKLPLVSALLKLQGIALNPVSPVSVSYFNSQSERVKILVGQKTQTITLPLTYYSFILTGLLFGSIFLNNSSLFYDCQHLIKCIETLFTSNSVSLVIPVNTPKSTFVPSSHCQ